MALDCMSTFFEPEMKAVLLQLLAFVYSQEPIDNPFIMEAVSWSLLSIVIKISHAIHFVNNIRTSVLSMTEH